MGLKHEKVRAALREFTRPDPHVLSGTVSNVDESEYTCTVTLANEHVIEEVQLKALRGINTGMVIVPEDGSYVQILRLEGAGAPDYLVIAAEKIKKQVTTINGTILTIDENGYNVSRGGESLTKILTALLTALIEQTFSNGAGTTTPSSKLADLQDLQTRLNNLLT